MQLLGNAIFDPGSLEDGDASGLSLLDVTTTLAPEKVTRQIKVGWAEGGRLRGYEIQHGAGAGAARYGLPGRRAGLPPE